MQAFAVAGVIAYLLYPLVDKLIARGLPQKKASLVIFLSFMIASGLVIAAIAIPLSKQAAEVVRDYLAQGFFEPHLRLNARDYRRFLMQLPERGVAGGSAYDALVAATAAGAAAELATCDRRAVPIYESYGTRLRLL